MKRIVKKIKFRGSRGMSLVEVLVAFSLTIILLAAFVLFLQNASRINILARQNDEDVSIAAKAAVESTTAVNTATVTFTGSFTDTVNVNVYSGTSNDVSFYLFRP